MNIPHTFFLALAEYFKKRIPEQVPAPEKEVEAPTNADKLPFTVLFLMEFEKRLVALFRQKISVVLSERYRDPDDYKMFLQFLKEHHVQTPKSQREGELARFTYNQVAGHWHKGARGVLIMPHPYSTQNEQDLLTEAACRGADILQEIKSALGKV